MYRLAKDDDGHSYVIPADKSKEFEEWLDRVYRWYDSKEEESVAVAQPDWAVSVDNWHRVVFPSYQVD